MLRQSITANNVGSAADPVHSGVSKFSGGSIYFDGSTYSGAGSYLSVPDSDRWNFGTGDFTVDFWIRLNNLGTSSGGGDYRPHQEIIGNYDNTSGFRIGFVHKGTSEDGIWLYGPSINLKAGNITGWVVDTWYHIAVVRSSGYASIYKDGVLRAGPTSWTTDVGDSSHPLIMGMDPRANPPTGYPLDGYLDEIRVTKGTALWISAFTPPTRRNRSASIVDLSGNYNGINLATKTTTDIANYRDAQVIEPVASALWDFDGTDEYLDTGLYLSSTCSISLWYKRTEADITSSADNVMNVNAWNNTGSNNFFYMQIGDPYYNPSPEGSVSCWAYGYTSGVRADWHPTPPGGAYEILSKLNVWRNLCLTFDSSKGYVYMDGVFINSADLPFTGWKPGDPGYSATNNGFSTLIFGAKRNYGSTGAPASYFNGEMAQCMVFDATLTAAQVRQNFNALRNRFKV
jgi:hypothetical protein